MCSYPAWIKYRKLASSFKSPSSSQSNILFSPGMNVFTSTPETVKGVHVFLCFSKILFQIRVKQIYKHEILVIMLVRISIKKMTWSAKTLHALKNTTALHFCETVANYPNTAICTYPLCRPSRLSWRTLYSLWPPSHQQLHPAASYRTNQRGNPETFNLTISMKPRDNLSVWQSHIPRDILKCATVMNQGIYSRCFSLNRQDWYHRIVSVAFNGKHNNGIINKSCRLMYRY